MTPPEQKVTYYSKTTDDFAGTNIRTRTVDATFPFIHKSILWKAAAFLLYYAIAIPLVTLYVKAFNRTKFVNRRALRRIRGGFFLYGNHTHWSDAFLPHAAAAMKRTYILASPDSVSVKGIKNIVTMLGGIPLPTKPEALRAFYKAVRQRCSEGGCIAVYPEAHIWPYYTGVRPFSAVSFAYPAEFRAPVVAMVTTFRERKGLCGSLKKPGHTVILSDPIYAEPGMSVREAQRYFHRRVTEFMVENTSRPDNYVHIRYVQK
jgi:1-acyl-sn-glycerol-3-phosphate acyltransferase